MRLLTGETMRKSVLVTATVAGFLVTAAAHAQSGSELFVEVARTMAKSNKDAGGAEKRVRSEPTTADMRVVNVQLPLLSGSGNAVMLNLPGAALTANGSVSNRNGENYTWVGRIVGEQLSSVVLVVRDGKVTGEVRARSGLFRITPLEGDGHALVRVNEANLPPDHDREETPTETQKSKRSGKRGDADKLGGEYVPPSKTYTLKVLVAYTADAERVHPDILARIDEAEATANLSYERSDVRIKLKIAGTYKTDYQETGQVSQDRNVTEVLEKRGEYGADMAVLLVSRLKRGDKELCGSARAIGAGHRTAFVVVKSSCLGLTMAHEIGHLLGIRHNWEKDKNEGACGGFGHGLYNIVSGWRTVMAYDCNPPAKGACKRFPVWSNPRMKDDYGAPLGHAQYADEARCLNMRISAFCSGNTPCAHE